LGDPDFDELPQNGIRHVMYKYDENHSDVLSMVPYVNIFAGGQKIRSQLLRITYKDDIVQEHEFTDETASFSGGIVNATVRKAPTPGVAPPAPAVQPK
jgi:hypothetical protein